MSMISLVQRLQRERNVEEAVCGEERCVTRLKTFYDGEDGDHRAGYMYYVVLECGDFGPVLSAVSLLRVEEISKGMKILVF